MLSGSSSLQLQETTASINPSPSRPRTQNLTTRAPTKVMRLVQRDLARSRPEQKTMTTISVINVSEVEFQSGIIYSPAMILEILGFMAGLRLFNIMAAFSPDPCHEARS